MADGLRAAEAKGNKGGRRPVVAAAKAADVRAAYLGGQSIAALARDHHVSRGAIRTAITDLMPEHVADHQDAPALELPVVVDVPGKVADFLRATELEPAERAALDQGVTVRGGQGYTLRVTAIPAVHRQLLDRCQPFDNAAAIPAQREARREYTNRVNARPAAAGTRSISAPTTVRLIPGTARGRGHRHVGVPLSGTGFLGGVDELHPSTVDFQPIHFSRTTPPHGNAPLPHVQGGPGREGWNERSVRGAQSSCQALRGS